MKDEFAKERVILVNVNANDDSEDLFDELSLLARTADYDVVGHLVQHKSRPELTYYLGTGKVEELKQLVEALNADTVIFDNDLSGSQFNNLEKYLGVDVIDRATLILEIFARHATSNEGKLQVELARKKHCLPRVLGQMSHYSRQGGGGGGGAGARRGGGEQKLEMDRRTARKEIFDLQQRINKLGEERGLRRTKRRESKIKLVSIVGYTNAGKSTLMNALTKAGVLEEDKLFATLDPVSRKMWLQEGKEFIITDTVGFISRLPHEFIEAFKSTLEETQYSDLILHVVNCASADSLKEYEVVKEVLSGLRVDDVPIITVLNKCDVCEPKFLPMDGEAVRISARTGMGLATLKDKIANVLFGESVKWE